MNVRLHEREAAVGAIQRVLDAAFADRGGTVFVVAPAGLGKTSVLAAAVALARDRFDVRIAGGDDHGPGGESSAALLGSTSTPQRRSR